MAERVVCPKCSRASYTTAPEVFGPCPYCGFVFNWRSPDRRVFERVSKGIPLTLEKNGNMQAGRTIDLSRRGVGVITQATSFFEEGDEVRCSFESEKEEARDSRVVWIKEDAGKQMVGLLFV